MEKKLHSRPDLGHLKSQAKTFLVALRAGEKEAIRLACDQHPSLDLEAARLADAQLIIARRNGFASWPKLGRHVEQLRSLEGIWEFDSLELEGSAAPPSSFEHARILIDGDRFRTEFPGMNYEGEFLIDVETDPHTIDIQFAEGSEAGNTALGLFSLEGERLTLCLPSMAGVARPTGFGTAPGSHLALEVLRRVTKDRPATSSPFSTSLTPFHDLVEGEWVAVRLVLDGKTMPKGFVSSGRRVSHGIETTVTFGGQTVLDGQTRYDESNSPVLFDFWQRSSGKVLPGIAEVAGEVLRVCLGPADGLRPSAFASARGSGNTLSEWVRS